MLLAGCGVCPREHVVNIHQQFLLLRIKGDRMDANIVPAHVVEVPFGPERLLQFIGLIVCERHFLFQRTWNCGTAAGKSAMMKPARSGSPATAENEMAGGCCLK